MCIILMYILLLYKKMVFGVGFNRLAVQDLKNAPSLRSREGAGSAIWQVIHALGVFLLFRGWFSLFFNAGDEIIPGVVDDAFDVDCVHLDDVARVRCINNIAVGFLILGANL